MEEGGAHNSSVLHGPLFPYLQFNKRSWQNVTFPLPPPDILHISPYNPTNMLLLKYRGLQSRFARLIIICSNCNEILLGESKEQACCETRSIALSLHCFLFFSLKKKSTAFLYLHSFTEYDVFRLIQVHSHSLRFGEVEWLTDLHHHSAYTSQPEMLFQVLINKDFIIQGHNF